MPTSPRVGPSREQVENWSTIFTAPVVWAPLIAEVMRREGLGALGSLEAGLPGTNAVFIVNGALVAKLFWPRFEQDQAREIEAHRLLADVPEVPAPRVLAAGHVDDELTWRYIVSERLPGLSLGEVRARFPRADLLRLAAEFGEIVRAFHGIPVPASPSPLARSPDGWREWVRAAVAAAPDRHASDLAGLPRIREELPGFLASVDLDSTCEPLRLLHCDLTADHLLVQERGGQWRITGLIDWGDADVGSVDYEWVALHIDCLAGDHELARAFFRGYGRPFDEEAARRATASCFLHRFVTMAWVLAAAGEIGPEAAVDDLVEGLWGGVTS